MSISFRAHCARDHDRQDFTDPAAFEQHMTTVHKARKLQPGDGRGRVNNGAADARPCPSWSGGKIAKPHPWTAPKPTPGGLEKVRAAIAAGEYTWGGRGYGPDAAEVVADDEIPATELRPGDVFMLPRLRFVYDVLDVDPDRGWHVRMRAKGKVPERTGWLSELRTTGPSGVVYDTVAVVSRAPAEAVA